MRIVSLTNKLREKKLAIMRTEDPSSEAPWVFVEAGETKQVDMYLPLDIMIWEDAVYSEHHSFLLCDAGSWAVNVQYGFRPSYQSHLPETTMDLWWWDHNNVVDSDGEYNIQVKWSDGEDGGRLWFELYTYTKQQEKFQFSFNGFRHIPVILLYFL